MACAPKRAFSASSAPPTWSREGILQVRLSLADISYMKVSYWLKCKGERILLVTKVRRIFGGRNTCESIWLIKKFTKVIYCHLMLLFTHLLLSTSHRKNDNMSSWRRRLNINANRRNLSILIWQLNRVSPESLIIFGSLCKMYIELLDISLKQ